MRTRSTIIQSIANRLNSINWNRLKTSLLGKELIAYGAEVVAASENVKDTFIESLDYQKADTAGIISLSQINDVYTSDFRPAYIKVRVLGFVNPVIFKPFDLVLTSGSSSFTNISYCSSDEVITLYQGVVKTAVSALTPEDFSDFRYDTTVPYTITTMPSTDASVRNYLVLGRSAMPESVFYFKLENNVLTLMPKYTPLKYGADVEHYKLRTLSDMKQAIQLGDGIWGLSEFGANVEFQAIWLELSANEFSMEGTLVSTEYGQFSVDQVEFIASYAASEKDIDYARASYYKNMLETTVVNSKEQIREYCNSYPIVLDSNVVLANEDTGFLQQEYRNNVIIIYIKPTDQNDIGGFGEIEANLDVHGNIFTRHQTYLGRPIMFSVIVYNNGVEIPQVAPYISNLFNYSKLEYKQKISAAAIAAEIQSLFQANTYVLLQVTQVGSLLNLMSPIQSSIRLYNSLNQLTGFDSHGIIFKLVDDVNDDFIFGFGSSYGSSFLSNHYWDVENVNSNNEQISFRSGFLNRQFNLYSAETRSSRNILALLSPELIYNINYDLFSQLYQPTDSLCGLRLKNETIDEFPVITCSYPLDDMVVEGASYLRLLNNKDYLATTLAPQIQTSAALRTYIVSLEENLNWPTSNYDYTITAYEGCYINNSDIPQYIRPVDGVWEPCQPGDAGAQLWQDQIGIYQIKNLAIHFLFQYTIKNHTTEVLVKTSVVDYKQSFAVAPYDDVLIQFTVIDASELGVQGKWVSFNVFIDSMFWNFPDENANLFNCIRSIAISSNDTFSTEESASAFVDAIRKSQDRLPFAPFAPSVKFKDDKLYVCVKLSEGLILYVFNCDTRNLTYTSFNAKIVLSTDQVDCNGLLIIGDNIIVRGSDGMNYWVTFRNGVYTKQNNNLHFNHPFDVYNKCFLYQSKDEVYILYFEPDSGNAYNIYHAIGSTPVINNNNATAWFNVYTDMTSAMTDEFTAYTQTEIRNNVNTGMEDMYTSCPQLSFLNKNFVGLAMNFSNYPGRHVSTTLVTYNRNTGELLRFNSDNLNPTALQWKYPIYSGTVNYDSGEMNPGATINFNKIVYNTSLIDVKYQQYYPKLNTNTPVIWR